MKYIRLKMPMGLRWHGTGYQADNRWRKASFVRWDDGALMPTGGWVAFLGSNGLPVQLPSVGAMKTAHSWYGNAATVADGASYFMAVASHSNIYVVDGLGQVKDVTPSGVAPGADSPYVNRGYGGGLYGAQQYGTARQTEGSTKVPATTWALDNYGDWLIAVGTTDRKLWYWKPSEAKMLALSNAPNCLSMVTTEERFIFALAAEDSTGAINVRRVAWCDREDPETWDAESTNEAGGFELQTEGALRCGVRVRGRTLLLTTTDAHVAIYSGPPLVYGFQQVGKNCGVISDRAAATTGAGAFWMGNNDFYFYDGSAVRELPCEVHDYVFRFINRSYLYNIYAVANAANNEIWWFYTSTEAVAETAANGALVAFNDKYVSYDYKQNIWSFGEISRTSGVDSGVFNDPMWIDSDNYIWRHEVKNGFYGGALPFVESGPLTVGEGDSVMKATQVLTDSVPDDKITLEFKSRFEPQGVERSYGPYNVKPKTDIRVTGRQLRMRVESQSVPVEDLTALIDLADWEGVNTAYYPLAPNKAVFWPSRYPEPDTDPTEGYYLADISEEFNELGFVDLQFQFGIQTSVDFTGKPTGYVELNGEVIYEYFATSKTLVSDSPTAPRYSDELKILRLYRGDSNILKVGARGLDNENITSKVLANSLAFVTLQSKGDFRVGDMRLLITGGGRR